jgi:hypothetical protein
MANEGTGEPWQEAEDRQEEEDPEEVEAEAQLMSSTTSEFRALGTLLMKSRTRNNRIQKAVENLEQRVTRLEQEGTPCNITQTSKVSELEQKVMRLEINANKNSIIMLNIPEFEDSKPRQPTGETAAEEVIPRSSLLQLVNEILVAAGVPVNDLRPHTAWRLGAPKQNQERPRPIVIEFGTLDAQRICMQHNPLPGKIEKWKNCRFRPFLPPDYLRAQRRMYQVYDETSHPNSDISVQKARDGLRFQIEGSNYFVSTADFARDVVVINDFTLEVAQIVAVNSQKPPRPRASEQRKPKEVQAPKPNNSGRNRRRNGESPAPKPAPKAAPNSKESAESSD